MNQKFTIGDYITDSSNIYQVTGIVEQKNTSGKTEDYIHYQPILGSNKVFTASIPLGNLDKAGIRKVFTPTEIENIIKDIKDSKTEEVYNTSTAKEIIYSNNPTAIISVLVYYWKNTSTLVRTDKELLEEILEHLSKEIAWVTKKKAAAIKDEIIAILKKRV